MSKKQEKLLYIYRHNLQKLINAKLIDSTPEGYVIAESGKVLRVVNELPQGEKEFNWAALLPGEKPAKSAEKVKEVEKVKEPAGSKKAEKEKEKEKEKTPAPEAVNGPGPDAPIEGTSKEPVAQ